jgi:hypothetical protein
MSVMFDMTGDFIQALATTWIMMLGQTRELVEGAIGLEIVKSQHTRPRPASRADT